MKNPIKDYMDIIAKKYQSLPEGKEKDELYEEIKRIANMYQPTVKIEKIDEKKDSNG